MSSIVCVSGMQRSGTSVLSTWLELCGLRLHDDESLDVRHYSSEDRDFVKLHSQALQKKYPRVSSWKVAPRRQLTFTRETQHQANKLVYIRNQKYANWGWKDPRTVLYLEQWKKIVPDLKVVLVWRPCIDVAQSLFNRSRRSKEQAHHISRREAVKLWRRHNKQIIAFKKKHPDDTLLLPLKYVMQNDIKVFDDIVTRFNIPLTYEPIYNAYENYLMKKRSRSSLIKFLSRVYRCGSVEAELLRLSDSESLSGGNDNATGNIVPAY